MTPPKPLPRENKKGQLDDKVHGLARKMTINCNHSLDTVDRENGASERPKITPQDCFLSRCVRGKNKLQHETARKM